MLLLKTGLESFLNSPVHLSAQHPLESHRTPKTPTEIKCASKLSAQLSLETTSTYARIRWQGATHHD